VHIGFHSARFCGGRARARDYVIVGLAWHKPIVAALLRAKSLVFTLKTSRVGCNASAIPLRPHGNQHINVCHE